MNTGQPGEQGGAGLGNNNGGQQGSPGQAAATSTTAAATALLTSIYIAPSTTTSSTPTSTNTSTSDKSDGSHNINAAPIIGGVVGGIAVLLLLATLLVVCLQGRKQRKQESNREKRNTAERTTYAALNSTFRGVPFSPSPYQETQASLLPAPLFSPSKSPHTRSETTGGGISPYWPPSDRSGGLSPYAPPRERSGGVSPYALPEESYNGVPSPYSSPERDRGRGGETSPYSLPGERSPGSESDRFHPIYQENSSPPRREETPDRVNTADQHYIVSPISLHPTRSLSNALARQAPEEDAFISPPGISVPMFLGPQPTRDTMGFPVDARSVRSFVDTESVRTPLGSEHSAIQSEYHDLPIASPRPSLRPSNQNSLEQLVRGGMSTPEPSHPSPLLLRRNPSAAKKILNEEFMRESPVLGNKHAVKIYAPPQPSKLQQNIRRNESQRTVSSMSSAGPSMISDAELERLGVGRI